jgi:hypothetical protein
VRHASALGTAFGNQIAMRVENDATDTWVGFTHAESPARRAISAGGSKRLHEIKHSRAPQG